MSPRHTPPFACDGLTQATFVYTFKDPAAILSVRGEVDLYNEPQFSVELKKMPDSAVMVVDLTQCRYMDSSALQALVREHQARSMRLRIAIDDRSRLVRLFEVTQLNRTFRIFPTVRDAISDAAPGVAK